MDQSLADLAQGAHGHAFIIACTIAFSLVMGSFLNVVIHRLPVMMDHSWRRECKAHLDTPPLGLPEAEHVSLAYPPSTCPKCGHRIRPLENIPILSYLVLGGKCSSCRERISLRYPAVEALTAALSVIVVLRLGADWHTAAALGFTWALVALTVIDLDHQLLPDSITLPLLWAGLVVNQLTGVVPLDDAVWGAVFGYLSLWSVFWGFKLLTGKDGMGYGDFKLLAALGAWLGWAALPGVILLSSLVGAVTGILLISVRGRDRSLPIPFGPYLAAAGWMMLLGGETINAAYFRLLMP